MKYVLQYHPSEGFQALAREHGPAHVARLREFAGRGELLMVGPLDDPPSGEALGVFTTRESAEEFVRDDPFVVHGVVARWVVRPWNEILQP